jgi:methyl-accepting chemotaxis protein
MNKLSLNIKVLATIFVACVTCTVAAIVVSRMEISSIARDDLAEKSRAILSRLEVAREYIANMDIMETMIKETVKDHPDGKVPKDQQVRILKGVPIFASFKLGEKGSEIEHYKFRIFSPAARNKENTATPEELGLLKEIQSKSLKELVTTSADRESLIVARPVLIAKEQGCLTCHGAPSTSPWGNGKDVLGYPMEDMKDGDLRAVFAIVSSLKPAEATAMRATLNIILWGIGFTTLAMLLGFLVMRAVIGGVRRAIDDLNTSADQTLNASQQVATSSQAMAQGASEQAASLEETSSTLEEISSMTKQNADHTLRMEKLIDATRDSAGKGGESMERMVERINAIKAAADQTAKIIKTIDEIAFQTNLLALNAAVEAARAGDAGRGFAVVAEEVRNLALRSAQAAKDTSSMIEESQQRAQQGVSATNDAQSLLKNILVNVEETSGVVREVSSASKEQSRGVTQIALAITEMDKVTQTNAANAEENAAASEQLSAQAASQSAAVRDLTGVVMGGSGNGSAARRAALTGTMRPPALPRPAVELVHARARGGNGGLRVQIQQQQEEAHAPAGAYGRSAANPEFRDIRPAGNGQHGRFQQQDEARVPPGGNGHLAAKPEFRDVRPAGK